MLLQQTTSHFSRERKQPSNATGYIFNVNFDRTNNRISEAFLSRVVVS